MPAKALRFAFVLAVCFALTGCSFFWGIANRVSLKKDLESLLAQHGVNAEVRSCRMIGQTRGATAWLKISDAEADKLVGELHLRRVLPGKMLSYPEKKGCLSQVPSPETADSTWRFHGDSGRTPGLRLNGSTAFEFFYLYRQAGSGEACVDTGYSYG